MLVPIPKHLIDPETLDATQLANLVPRNLSDHVNLTRLQLIREVDVPLELVIAQPPKLRERPVRCRRTTRCSN